jgi:hypothetical protein
MVKAWTPRWVPWAVGGGVLVGIAVGVPAANAFADAIDLSSAAWLLLAFPIVMTSPSSVDCDPIHYLNTLQALRDGQGRCGSDCIGGDECGEANPPSVENATNSAYVAHRRPPGALRQVRGPRNARGRNAGAVVTGGAMRAIGHVARPAADYQPAPDGPHAGFSARGR